MRIYVIGVIIVLLSGCSNLPQKRYWQAELGWQLVHGIDVLQTINGPAQSNCYIENDPITKRLIGERPSTGEVIGWGIGSGLLHYGISKGLERIGAKPWIKGVWQGTMIGYATSAVVSNHRKGIRPWGDNNITCNGSFIIIITY